MKLIFVHCWLIAHTFYFHWKKEWPALFGNRFFLETVFFGNCFFGNRPFWIQKICLSKKSGSPKNGFQKKRIPKKSSLEIKKLRNEAGSKKKPSDLLFCAWFMRLKSAIKPSCARKIFIFTGSERQFNPAPVLIICCFRRENKQSPFQQIVAHLFCHLWKSLLCDNNANCTSGSRGRELFQNKKLVTPGCTSKTGLVMTRILESWLASRTCFG